MVNDGEQSTVKRLGVESDRLAQLEVDAAGGNLSQHDLEALDLYVYCQSMVPEAFDPSIAIFYANLLATYYLQKGDTHQSARYQQNIRDAQVWQNAKSKQ